MRVPPVVLFPIIPPVRPVRRKKDEPEEPISFCGHLRRLMTIQQRHMMLERMMFWMSKVGTFLGFGETVVLPKLSRSGYNFLGWFLVSGNGAPTTMPPHDMKVIAKWEEIK